METQVSSAQVLYLYGVIPRDQLVPERQKAGLEAVAFSSLVALVEPVPASEFSGKVLDERLQRLEWVASMAQKHSAVLEGAMEHGPIIPARLCTLFSNKDTLRELLVKSEHQFHDKLEQLRGRQEWGLKAFCDETKLRPALSASDPELKALEAAAARASPGQAYVLRKKHDSLLAELVSQRTDEVLDQVIDGLEDMTIDTRWRPLLSKAASGRSQTMSLNAALLVELTARAELRSRVDALSAPFEAEGFQFELTGPWPPYSFCDSEE